MKVLRLIYPLWGVMRPRDSLEDTDEDNCRWQELRRTWVTAEALWRVGDSSGGVGRGNSGGRERSVGFDVVNNAGVRGSGGGRGGGDEGGDGGNDEGGIGKPITVGPAEPGVVSIDPQPATLLSSAAPRELTKGTLSGLYNPQ